MNEKTEAALRSSIKHWEENAAATSLDEVSVSTSSCALCGLFNTEVTVPPPCKGCPVSERTGKRLCHGSPYTKATKRRRDWYFDGGAAFRAAAQEEVEFLKGLLPKSVMKLPTNPAGFSFGGLDDQ